MLNGLMNIGQSALNASQAWISVTGNNLANADTEGYSRQYVDQKDAGGLTYRPGAQPLGVNAQQIMRFFDAFLERSYVRQNANSSRWDQQDTIMATVENLFNEANRKGVSSAMTNFFNAWQDLALRPEDTSVRENLLSYADNLGDLLGNTMDSLKNIQDEMNVNIRHDVNRVNEISRAIADLNQQITRHTIDGMNNPNALLDKRDQLVRELSTLVDVETIDHGKGNFRVQLTTGQPLVDGVETYKLEVKAAQSENFLKPDSPYKGEIQFQGSDSHEYTIEILEGGDAGIDPNDPNNNNPKFRVSLDGGKTWLKDENGEDQTWDITYSDAVDKDGKPIKVVDEVLVKNLRISFSEAKNFNAGDRFTIVPKEGLYWIEPTRGPQNITPQIRFDGTDNPDRVTGGKLAAYYNVRDDNCGRYIDELDAMASSLIWEVNRLHTQGAGLDKLTHLEGQQRVEATDKPLDSAQAMLPNASRLQDGSVNFHFYDKDTGEYVNSTQFNFERGMSLDEVAEEIKGMYYEGKDSDGNPTQIFPLKATIQDNKLIIEMKEPNAKLEFAMGADSSGIMAALGLNSFFTGTGAGDLAVNSLVHQNTNMIAAGKVNGQFEVNVGDNDTAKLIGELMDKPVTITTMWKTVDNMSLNQYYANTVTTVGADRRLTKTNTEYHGALSEDLFDRVSSVTGVNMDEEMSNLIKFQHSYTAAAKMITTADQMLQTLLGLKQ